MESIREAPPSLPCSGPVRGIACPRLTGPGQAAYANGNPAKVTLSYTQGISNFGPQNATASQRSSPKKVRLASPPPLQVLRGEQYHFWIISSATNERFHLGSFTVDPSGVGKLDVVKKEGIPDKSWDLALISVEAEGSSPG